MEGTTESKAGSDIEKTTKNTEESENVETKTASPNESEYDSAGSYSEEEGEIETTGSRSSEGSVVIVERESGDGQESFPAKKVDDDEDKKNPQYIPKKGTFYEHDDRTADDPSEAPVEAEIDKDDKKKVWQEKKEKWSHDKFDDGEQAPKSRAELIATYGYDIRNEEGPPRARRRRRYGRGPNKYTRNWEDEDAYGKPVPPPRINKRPSSKNYQHEDFPPLPNENPEEEEEEARDSGENERNQNQHAEINGNPSRSATVEPSENHQNQPQESSSKGPPRDRFGSGRVGKPRREIRDSDYRGFTAKTRQVRNVKTEQKIVSKPHKPEFIHSQNFTNKNMHERVHDIDKGMAKLNVQDGVYKGGNKTGQRQGSMPPRLQNEQKGSKRYSSMRQRSLPESANPPYNQQAGYYTNDYNQQNQPTLIHPAPQIHPSTTQVAQIAPPPLAPLPQVPVTATPILQPAQFAAAPFPQGTAFLQASVAPPPFIAQQTPQIINYVPSQPQFPQGFQGFQPPFNPVTQPELYQPPSGITYYSTDQQVTQRMVPQKRPKAAIPIVAPPTFDLKGKPIKEDEPDAGSYETELMLDDQSGESVQEYAVQH